MSISWSDYSAIVNQAFVLEVIVTNLKVPAFCVDTSQGKVERTSCNKVVIDFGWAEYWSIQTEVSLLQQVSLLEKRRVAQYVGLLHTSSCSIRRKLRLLRAIPLVTSGLPFGTFLTLAKFR